MGTILLKAVAVAAFMALFRLAFRARWHDRTLRRHSLVLLPGRALLLAGVAIAILGPLASWLMLVTFPEFHGSASAARNWTLVALVSVAFGMFFVLRSLAPLVLVSRAGLVQRTTLLRVRHLAWRNVREVRYRSIRGTLQIVGPSFSVTVGLMMGGFSGLLDHLEASVPHSIARKALTDVRETMRALRQRRLT